MAPLALIVVSVVFAYLAIRAKRLIVSVLWLAGVSALLSVVFYIFGAHQVAVIELSVGAGLVTVLFAFAISVAGDEITSSAKVLPEPLSFVIAILFVLVLGMYASSLGYHPSASLATESNLADVLWQERGLDMLVQVVLIFSGVLGLIGLLAETKAPLDGSVAEEFAAKRDRDLDALELQLQDQPESSK